MALVGERVADAIAAAGTDLVFGLLSSSNLRIMSRLVCQHGARFYNVRHEAAAVGMADGYARATGRVGVASVTQGPGFTNALTALITAQRASSPVVLFAGDTSAIAVADNPFSALVQGLDQERVLAALGITTVRLSGATAERAIAEAFELARRRGPVVVLFPSQLQHRREAALAPGEPAPGLAVPGGPAPGLAVPGEPAPGVAVGPVLPPEWRESPPLTDPAALARAGEILASSSRLVILAGRGAVEADAGATLMALADRTGALLATTVRAAGLFTGHPYDLGTAGGFARPATAELLRRADCILACGASLNPFTLRNGLGEADAQFIHCDRDPAAIGRFLPPEQALVGDVGAVTRLLLEQLPSTGSPSWRAEAAAVLAHGDAADEVDAVAEAGTVDPRQLCRRLDALLPPERVVVTDSGYCTLFPVEYLRVTQPRNLLFTIDFGAVGSGIGPAMGAALGRPGTPVVLFVGDGGLLMTLGELDTAQRYAIPLLIVCLNDRAYGAEVREADRHGLPATLATFPGTKDLAGIAQAIGVPGHTVRDLADLADVPRLVADLRGPYLLDCRIPTVSSRVH